MGVIKPEYLCWLKNIIVIRKDKDTVTKKSIIVEGTILKQLIM